MSAGSTSTNVDTVLGWNPAECNSHWLKLCVSGKGWSSPTTQHHLLLITCPSTRKVIFRCSNFSRHTLAIYSSQLSTSRHCHQPLIPSMLCVYHHLIHNTMWPVTEEGESKWFKQLMKFICEKSAHLLSLLFWGNDGNVERNTPSEFHWHLLTSKIRRVAL